ncbi:MAG TPA: GntP family permease [Chthoniobacteraceae bacterium]|jgi:GntP family gluconate:H+ symporter|nr:GntP family permease [Chthoniobacteraceae bacterium]
MPILIVLLGSGLVIAAIIGLRLPAFLALIGAALIVASITPQDARSRSAARPAAAEVSSVAGDEFNVVSSTKKNLRNDTAMLLKARDGRMYPGIVMWNDEILPPHPAHPYHAIFPDAQAGVANVALEPRDLLISMAEWEKAEKAAKANPGEVVAKGFGDTVTSIGLLIALASVIGACLMESGAAERVVLAIRNVFGEERASLAFIPSGFLLCIPAFFDTVFYLLIPLGKAMRRKTGKDYLLYILSVVAGATMAHSLVPPTPGPSFVAAALNIPIATMMLGGAIVGLIAALAGYGYALWANRRWEIPLRDEAMPEAGTLQVHRTLPALGWSLVPILLPIALIALESLTDAKNFGTSSSWGTTIAHLGRWRDAIWLVGNKNMALAIGAATALVLLAGSRKWQWRSLAAPLNVALESAGVILLITPAGGAFGQALRATDVAGVLSSMFSGSGLWLLPAAFFVTTLVRLAQGSATVAMITAVGIVAPLAIGVDLGYNPVYLALAIGCGSKPIPWMNDSGFWIISKMTGMTEGETLKTASVMMGVMGFTGFAVTMLGAWLLPFR